VKTVCAVAIAIMACAGAMQAQLRLCNDTPYKISVAIAYFAAGSWQSEGWYNFEAAECGNLTNKLTNRYYYIHAHAVQDSSTTWGNDYEFCTVSRAFTITGDKRCAARGYESNRFLRVDTGSADSFTQRLTCGNDCKMKSGWFLSYAARDVPGGITIDGNTYTTPAKGWLKVDFSGSELYATLTVDADVSSLQHGLPHIIRAHVNNNDDCDYILNMHTISLSPSGSALRVYSAGHYEDWECLEYETIFGDVDLGKHRLFEQDGDATAILRPQTDGRSVWIDVNVVDMNANGLLGTLMNSDWFGPWIRDEILASVPQMVQLGRIDDLFPPELQGFPLRLLDVSFYDRGGGTLGLRTAAKVTVSKEYAQSVWKRLQ
jgi:uncharacterized membrane protein